MTLESRVSQYREAVGLGVLTAAAVTASLVGGDTELAVTFAVLLPAVALLVLLGRRRSSTLAAASGLGDERDRLVSQRATAVSGTIMAYVLVGAWLVTVAQGDPDPTLTWLCAVSGMVYIVCLTVFQRRT